MNLWWSKVNPAVSYCSLFTLSFIVVLIVILCITIFYFCRLSKVEDEEFSKKYGTLYTGLDLTEDGDRRKSALAFPLLFILRRLIFVFFVIMMDYFVWSQIAVQFACCTFMIIYLGHVWPF